MLKKKILYLFIFIFCLPVLAFGEENTSPVISLGKVSTTWKGFLNIPFWTDAIISFSGITPVTLPEEATSFKFGLNWRGENETRASQKCTIISRVEVETYPNSGEWKLLFEEAHDVISRGGIIEEKPIVTKVVQQEKPEVKYKISVEVLMPFGQKIKPNTTYVTVYLTSKAYFTYTSIPIIPVTILHDPSGDGSYSALQPQTCISHLLSINMSGLEVKMEEQKELLLELQNANIKIEPTLENKNMVKITCIFKDEVTSAISEDPCLIGPGLGDTYILIKDLPVRFKFSKTFTPAGEEIKNLTFSVVTPQEAGLSPKRGCKIILIPAAALRSYDKNCPIFGTWRKLDLDDQMRQQLIEMNIGWDNSISESEKSDVVDLGEGYLNFKEQTIKKYTQDNLNKVSFYSEMIMDPYFATTASIPISKDKILVAITLNESPLSQTIPMDSLVVSLEDNERQNIPVGDFFTYQFYQDMRFGSLLLLTKDDKTKEVSLDSLQSRSFSSNPREYWTEDLNMLSKERAIYGVITSTTGEGIENVNLELRLKNERIKKVTSKLGGTYTIIGLISENEYTLIAEAEGYRSKTVEIHPFLDKELCREINIILEKIPPQIVKAPDIEEIKPSALELPSKELTPTLPPPTPPLPSKEKVFDLLTNGDFSAGLKGWKLVKVGVGKEMYANVIKNDFTYPYALEIKRRGSLAKYGQMGVMQRVNKDVSKYTQLILKANVKVISSSLESDGTRGGAYPIGIQIDYLDEAGKIHSWRHGFLYAEKINYPGIGEKIPQDEWFTYLSNNLLELKPVPKVIKEIKLLGSGWRFHSRMANVELVVTE